MGVYLYPNNTETELKNAYIGIPFPESIVLDKSSISLTTIGQTEQLTATIEPTISDHSITWSSDDTTVATVDTTGLVTCVTPGTCTITATTVNGLTASCGVGTGRLPSAYQEVEYIQNTGTQAIDCNIVIGATKLKTDLKINSQYIGESAIFISRRALNGNFLMFYNNAFRWHSASAVDIPCSLNTDYTIQTENGKITINGASYTCTASSSDSGSDLSMCIFGKSGAPTYGRFKLYYMKMWDNTTLVRDLVPCYRKQDTEIGMYDLVNDVFYTNSGTGTFTKGPDVN